MTSATPPDGVTTVAIDPQRALGQVDRRVFGGFVEHLGRCIYGAFTTRVRALRRARIPYRRAGAAKRPAPAACCAGRAATSCPITTGKTASAPGRPARSAPSSPGAGPRSNQFGTDEYIDYCAELGAEPYICLNMGTGTLEEALAWVEYCNWAGATYWADRAGPTATTEPYGVHWWGLGNEIYGEWQVGAMSAEEYMAEATRWARAIKMSTRSARLVSCGELGWTDWDPRSSTHWPALVDLHSIHLYTGSDGLLAQRAGAAHAPSGRSRRPAALLRRAAYNRGLPGAPRLVYDEWNVWFRSMTGALEERFVFSDALAVGLYLNIFVRNCAWVAMANLAQMVNAIAPIVTSPQAAVVQPIYYPFLLHAQGHLETAVNAFVTGPTVEAPAELKSRWPYPITDLGPFPLVDVAATVDQGRGRLAVTLMNRSEHPEQVLIRLRDGALTGPARLRSLTGAGKPLLAEGSPGWKRPTWPPVRPNPRTASSSWTCRTGHSPSSKRTLPPADAAAEGSRSDTASAQHSATKEFSEQPVSGRGLGRTAQRPRLHRGRTAHRGPAGRPAGQRRAGLRWAVPGQRAQRLPRAGRAAGPG